MAVSISISQIIKEVGQSRGNLTVVANNLGCSRMHIYRQIQKSAKLKAVIDEARDKKLDHLEDEAYNQAMSGNTALLIFLLKTQGKGRGYVERSEVKHEGEQNITLVWGDE